MSPEIELKLAMAPEALRRLARHPLLRPLAGGRRARRQTLVAIYYDTPDRRLAAAGMALRVRGDGRRFVQTLKAPAPDPASGLQRLVELEATVPGEALDLSRITEPAIAALLAEPEVGPRLAPVFATRIERRLLPLRFLDSDIELAMDAGEVRAGALAEPISEAEFELKSGRPERLWQLALALSETLDLRLETRSKAARGHALAAGSVPGPALAARLALPAEATAGQACLAVLRNGLDQLVANERAVLSGTPDPEGIHQLRVAVRRLRAALALFRPILAPAVTEWLAAELNWLQGALGPARDWDVFVLDTLDPLAQRLPGESGLRGLEARAAAERRAARAAAEAALGDRRYVRLLLQLELWLEDGSWRLPAEPGALVAPADEPAEVFARAALARRARQVLKRGRRRDEADEDSLHALRIAGKKLRYALEFFRALLPKAEAKAALEALRQLQDCLGSLNDAAVGRRLLAEAGAAGHRPDEARALGIVVGWQTGRIDADLHHLRRAWKRAKKALAPLAEG
jgi:triphosphatase